MMGKWLVIIALIGVVYLPLIQVRLVKLGEPPTVPVVQVMR